MDRRAFLSLLAISPALAAASPFSDFKEDMDGGFELYQKRLNDEFSEYKKILSEEFSSYQSNLSKTWRDSVISSRHVWVQYSNNYKTRSLVDFEKNTLKIETIIDDKSSSASAADIKKHLDSLLKQDTKTALQNDGLVRNIEARLGGFKYVVESDIPEEDPILSLAYEGERDTGLSADLNALVEFDSEAVYSPEKSLDPQVLDNALASGVTQESQGRSARHVVINLSSSFLKRRAKKQALVVLDRADKYKVNFPTLMSVMHTESTFNPMALSASAYGLMMINPETSGRRAHKMLYGKEAILTPTFLTNNVNNIEYGSAYFHLLYYNYLKEIVSPENRLLCSISAYNAGLGNVARAFSGQPVLKKAFDVINTKTSDAVLKILQDQLPYEENKIYLSKVKERVAYYSD